MIYLFTALYDEAYPFLQYYKMKKEINSLPFEMYRCEEQQICLTITGTGEITAGDSCRGCLCNGTCESGRYLCAVRHMRRRRTEKRCGLSVQQNYGRSDTKDILPGYFIQASVSRSCGCNRNERAAESKCVRGTCMSESGYAAKYGYGKSGELCDTELYNIELYDMEAAAGYQAAHHFFGPHQMFFIKIISDNGVQEKMSADTVRELVQAQIGQIAQAVERFAAAERDYAREQQVLSQEEQRQAERLSHDMHCSAVMEAELFQLLKYCRLSGIDYEDIIRDGYAVGSLPCKDKKEGKRCLEQLRKELL